MALFDDVEIEQGKLTSTAKQMRETYSFLEPTKKKEVIPTSFGETGILEDIAASKTYSMPDIVEGTGAAATGLFSWVPTGLTMTGHTEPESFLAPDYTEMSQEEKVVGAQKVGDLFSYEPKTTGSKEVAEGLAKPFTFTKEVGLHSQQEWYQMADKARLSGDKKTAAFYDTMGVVAGIGGEAIWFAGVPKIVGKVKTKAVDVASIKEKAKALENITNRIESLPDSPEKSASMAALGRSGVLDIVRPKPVKPTGGVSPTIAMAPKEESEIARETLKIEQAEEVAPQTKPEEQIARDVEGVQETERITGRATPEVLAEWEKDFRESVELTSRQEKESDPKDWTPGQKAAWERGDWETFSVLRGYTPKQIAEYREYLKLDKIGEALGVPETDRQTIVHNVTKMLEAEKEEALAKQIRDSKKGAPVQEAVVSKIKETLKDTIDDRIKEEDIKVITKKPVLTTDVTEKIDPGASSGATTGTLSPSKFSPHDTLFNNPDLARNTTYAWRSMGWKEYEKLIRGEHKYTGDKAESKGNYLAGIPESAAQFVGEGKFLVEFGGVKIGGGEGLLPGSVATRDNVTRVWGYDKEGAKWVELTKDDAMVRLTMLKNKEKGVVVKPAETKVGVKSAKLSNKEVEDVLMEEYGITRPEAKAVNRTTKEEFTSKDEAVSFFKSLEEYEEKPTEPIVKAELTLAEQREKNDAIADELLKKAESLKPKERDALQEAVKRIKGGDIAGAKRVAKTVSSIQDIIQKAIIIPATKLNDYFGQKGEITFHGTRRQFTKFLDEYKGTGTGGMMKGSGFYTTSLHEIGKHYADLLGGNQDIRIGKTGLANIVSFEDHNIYDFLLEESNGFINRESSGDGALYKEKDYKSFLLNLIQYEQKFIEGKIERDRQVLDTTNLPRDESLLKQSIQMSISDIKALEKVRRLVIRNGVTFSNTRYIHHVDIDPTHYIDLDVPIPKDVASKIQKGLLKLPENKRVEANKIIKDLEESQEPLTKQEIDIVFDNMCKDMVANPDELRDFTSPKNTQDSSTKLRAVRDKLQRMGYGEGLKRKDIQVMTGFNPYQIIGITGDMVRFHLENLMGRKETSRFLYKEAGIPGSTYIGESSGVRNYVSFDPELMKIVKTETLESLGFQTIYEKLVEYAKESPTMERLAELSKAIYLSGAESLKAFASKMQTDLGKVWGVVKDKVTELWLAAKAFNERLGERGAIGDKISGEEAPKKKSKSDIVQLTESLRSGKRETIEETGRRLANQTREDVKGTFRSSKDFLGRQIDVVNSTFTQIQDAYLDPPKWTHYSDMLGKYIGATQKGSLEAKVFAKEIRKEIRDPLTREAITNYVQADGNLELIGRRVEELANNEKIDAKLRDKLVKGYEKALTLTEHEKHTAENIRQYYNAKLQDAQSVGMLEHGYNNYVNQMWEKPNKVTRQAHSDIQLGKMRLHPDFIKKRVHDSYFEGEMRGLVPKSKDIAYLVAQYDTSFTEAMAARSFIKLLQEGKAEDGRPLVAPTGRGEEVIDKREILSGLRKGQTREEVKHYVYPDAKTTTRERDRHGNILEEYNTDDYMNVDHPALRKWKWVETTSSGETILVRGMMGVHPEIMQERTFPTQIKDNLRNVLQGSRMKNPIFRATAELSATFKGTMLSMSPFHQVQTGLHAIFHSVNPFGVNILGWKKTTALDFSDPMLQKACDTGLIVADYKGMEAFSEGLTSGGLVSKIPFIGRFFQAYTEYLFQDYIPRLKYGMWKEAYRRNTKRYGNMVDKSGEKIWSEEMIASLTSDQSNAAFGELNYKKMGRDQTTQDWMRMMFLAPDFLEARTRFVGQALRQYGKGWDIPVGGDWKLHIPNFANEQFTALAIRGAGGLFIGARIVNALLGSDDDPLGKPFSVILKDKEYTVRSVPGDLYHLVSDIRNFLFYRLNPLTIRTLIEGLTSRDQFNRYRDWQDQWVDMLSIMAPIALQKRGEESAFTWDERLKPSWEGVLRSCGVGIFKARTDMEKKAIEMHSHKISYTPDRTERQRYKWIKEFGDRLRESYLSGDDKDYNKVYDTVFHLLDKGALSREDLEEIKLRAHKDPLMQTMKFITAEEMFECIKKANFEEEMKYEKPFQEKLHNLQKEHPDRYRALMDKYYEYYDAGYLEKKKIWLRDYYQQSVIGVAMGHNLPAQQSSVEEEE